MSAEQIIRNAMGDKLVDEMIAEMRGSSLAAPDGSVTITYQQLEKVLQDCRWGVQSAPGEYPPDGYEALPSEQAEIADACWHRGMDQLSTALLNWCHDQLKAQSPNSY